MSEGKLLTVEGLTLAVRSAGTTVVNDISFDLSPGEIVGIVGESGSGKTMSARAVMRLEPPAIQRTAGSIRFDGAEITTLGDRDIRRIRGGRIGLVFQEPMTSLNPSMLLGEQLDEGLRLHTRLPKAPRRERIIEMLTRIGMRQPERALTSYPHEFSGGMRQRIMLASVMLLKPALLIADEPTTALDALVQREVLELMGELVREQQTAVLMISHDLPMVARYADRIIVMQHGRIVEQGQTATLMRSPRDAYTRKLLGAIPRRLPARDLPRETAPLIEARNVVLEYPGGGLFQRTAPTRALGDVSLAVWPGEVLAVVGESGSGKTTLGRVMSGLLRPRSGDILFRGAAVAPGTPGWADYRANCQVIFQDPQSSLDPRMKVRDLVGEALRLETSLDANGKNLRIAETLLEVGLGKELWDRFPHELSGGQRQRVAIARAVVRRPAFVIADEPVSALDVTIRAQVLELLAELQKSHGFSCLFISHDLGVVEQVADRVVVMNGGRIVEEGLRDRVFDAPEDEYTRRLLAAIPAIEASGDGFALRWRGEMPAAGNGTSSNSNRVSEHSE